MDKIDSLVNRTEFDFELEPSAGTGSFFNLLNQNKRIGLDLDPKVSGIIKTDFFDWTWPQGKKIITIGNPPFGKNANLAVKFFNQSAKFSDVIAFIVPKTFRKESITNRLSLNFHCIHDEDVPEYSFIFNNNPYDVWCCAQIWVRKDTARSKKQILKMTDFKKWFSIVEPTDADFSIQRVGGKAGMIRTENFNQYSKLSHYFFKAKDDRVLQAFQAIDFDEVKFNTAGNPSVSPNELLQLWKVQAQELGLDV